MQRICNPCKFCKFSNGVCSACMYMSIQHTVHFTTWKKYVHFGVRIFSQKVLVSLSYAGWPNTLTHLQNFILFQPFTADKNITLSWEPRFSLSCQSCFPAAVFLFLKTHRYPHSMKTQFCPLRKVFLKIAACLPCNAFSLSSSQARTRDFWKLKTHRRPLDCWGNEFVFSHRCRVRASLFQILPTNKKRTKTNRYQNVF